MGAVEIYGIRYLVDGVVYYVGQTRNSLKKRWQEHRKGKTVVSCAIKTFGFENFEIFGIEKVAEDQANDRERHWIANLGTLAPKGLNRREGGFASRMSETTKTRMSEARRKLWADPDFHARTTAALNASWTDERKRRAAVTSKLILTETTLRKMARINSERVRSESTRRKSGEASRARWANMDAAAKKVALQPFLDAGRSEDANRKRAAKGRQRFEDEDARAKHSARMREWWAQRKATVFA